MASAFSTNSDDAFTKTVEICHESEIKDEEFADYFEIEKCILFIENGSYERVALQFPDELLSYSFKTTKLIEEKVPNAKLYILGDTTYGSCCVDEIAAEHFNADCIIHFGRSCLSKTSRLPVLFIFGKCFIDVNHFCQNFMKTFEDASSRILLFYDVIYHHAIEEIENSLRKHYECLIIGRLMIENEDKCKQCLKARRYQFDASSQNFCKIEECCKKEETELGLIKSKNDSTGLCACQDKIFEKDGMNYERFGRTFPQPSGTSLEDFTILYIGKENLTLTNVMMSYNRNKFFKYDPDRNSIQHETVNINKSLMKRYYLIQKAKEAKTIGIVAGTLGVADYLVIIEHLKNLIKDAGKKYYTFMMGKPNIAKMANFLEIDIFVLVACPENSLIDSQEFYKPIITPFEMEIACSRQKEWTGEYVTDFSEILQGEHQISGVDTSNSKINSEEPEYSLISGNLIKTMNLNEKDSNTTSSSDLVLQNQENAITNFGENSSAYFLHTRSWSGLEKKLGETEVVDAVEGRTGIAIGYTHERTDSNSQCNQVAKS